MIENGTTTLIPVELEEKIARYRTLKELIANMEVEIGSENRSHQVQPGCCLKHDIELSMMGMGVKTLTSERLGLTVTAANGKSASTISRELLLNNGVSADVIVACTVAGKAYSYIQVKKVKGEGK